MGQISDGADEIAVHPVPVSTIIRGYKSLPYRYHLYHRLPGVALQISHSETGASHTALARQNHHHCSSPQPAVSNAGDRKSVV